MAHICHHSSIESNHGFVIEKMLPRSERCGIDGLLKHGVITMMLEIQITPRLEGGFAWSIWRDGEAIAEGVAPTERAALAAATSDLDGMNEFERR